jgi:hypothetical protein
VDTLTQSEQTELRALVEDLGRTEAAKRLELHPQTLDRLLCHPHARTGTLSKVRAGLALARTRAPESRLTGEEQSVVRQLLLVAGAGGAAAYLGILPDVVRRLAAGERATPEVVARVRARLGP